MRRREFLRGTLTAGAAAALLPACGGASGRSGPARPAPARTAFSDPGLVELADLALDTARSAGARSPLA